MDKKKEKNPGVESVEQGFVEEPVLAPAEEIEAESFAVSAAELENDMKNAGFETPEKKDHAQGPSGVEQVESGFQDQPAQDVVAAAYGSGVVTSAELAEDLRAAGIEVPERPAKKSAGQSGPSGTDLVEEGYKDQPAQDDVVAAAFTSGVVSPSELSDNLRAAGIEVPEKPAKEPAGQAGPSGIDLVEDGYRDQPVQGDVVAAAFTSGVVSPSELSENLKAAGIEVPEKPAKAAGQTGPSGTDLIEEGYKDQPAQDDAVAAAFASGVVSPTELTSTLKAAGIEVPEKPAKKHSAEKAEKPAPAVDGVEQVETGFRTESPLDVLAAASMSANTSSREWASNLRSVGVEVPERPEPEEEEDGTTGIDSIQSGFTAEPELNTVEELNAIKYAAAPQEVDEKVEQVQSERLGERIQVNDALLSKLKESGYTGDLDDLRKLFSDLKDN